jgi:outer membrane immunogenic protein
MSLAPQPKAALIVWVLLQKEIYMRKLALIAALAAFTATPALAAGEGRIEARGGLATGGGAEEAFAGIAAGYDFDLGGSGFAGLEVSGDKVLAGGADVIFGVAARAGAKVGEKSRVYAIGGMGFADGESDPFIGAGAEFGFGGKAYGKVEYRRVITSGGFPDINFFGVGVGTRF